MKQVIVGDPAQVKRRIWLLDLDPIVVKLTDTHDGKNWTVEQALRAVEEYRRFLFLTVTRPETIVPTEFIDDVWHAHILDTMKYAEDCDWAFGFFLHHFPYFGMRGEDDQALLQATFRATAEIYQKEFGSSYYIGLDPCGAHNSSACGCGACSGEGVTAHGDLVNANIRPTLTM